MYRRSTLGIAVVVGLLVLAVVVLEFGLWLPLLDTGEYERGEVRIADEGGEHLGSVAVRIADTPNQRTIGLSRTDSLGPDEGMWFVHEEAGTHRYVMRKMAFGLDIVFVAPNWTITGVHHADPPGPLTPESLLERYTGQGKYVLEVPRGWTNETGVSVGDRVLDPARVGTGGDGGGTQTATPAAPAPTGTPTGPRVTAIDPNGSRLGTVTVAVANDPGERFTGLSETDSLAWNEGMLFVYESTGRRTFVMRNMSFPLDMVFVAGNGTVTRIHHAPVPPAGSDEADLERYRGTARYVLEVNRGWSNATGLTEGDTVRVPAGY